MINQKDTLKEILDSLPQGPPAAEVAIPKMANRRRRPLHRREIRRWRKPGGATGYRAHHRVHFRAQVILMHDGQKILGESTAISKTGVFVQTEATIFAQNDVVELLIIPWRSGRTFQVKAEICHVTSWPAGSEGFGMKFLA